MRIPRKTKRRLPLKEIAIFRLSVTLVLAVDDDEQMCWSSSQLVVKKMFIEEMGAFRIGCNRSNHSASFGKLRWHAA